MAKLNPRQQAALKQALTTLPRQQRLIVVLKYVDDLTEPEIAVVTRSSPDDVRASLAGAMRDLRAALKDSSRPTSSAVDEPS